MSTVGRHVHQWCSSLSQSSGQIRAHTINVHRNSLILLQKQTACLSTAVAPSIACHTRNWWSRSAPSAKLSVDGEFEMASCKCCIARSSLTADSHAVVSSHGARTWIRSKNGHCHEAHGDLVVHDAREGMIARELRWRFATAGVHSPSPA